MAQRAVARGSISFVDLNDGKSLSLYLTSNHPTTQLHFVDGISGYSPDYEFVPAQGEPDDPDNGPLIIYPNLYVSGSTTNQIAQIATTPHWWINNVEVNTDNNGASLDTLITANFPEGVAFDTTTPYALRISKNALVNTPQMNIFCKVVFYDIETYSSTVLSAQITITTVDVAPGTIIAYIRPLDLPIISNDTDTIRLQCVVKRGNKSGNMIAGDDDGGQFSFQWFREDDPFGVDAYEWHKIVDTYTGQGGAAATGTLETGDQWEEIYPDGITGYNTDVISIPASTITNLDGFGCLVTDIEQGSGTLGFQVWTGAYPIVDHTDNYSIGFDTPAGNIITRGTTSLSATAIMYCRGLELDPNDYSKFNFLWTKADKDGNVVSGLKPGDPGYSSPVTYKHGNASGSADTNWSVQNPFNEQTSTYCRYAIGRTEGASARELTVYRAEVETKSTFKLEVYLPQS